jgi:hypothetical protein
MLLVVAGTLEGFVSPIPWWPLEGKLAVSGVTVVFLVLFLRSGRTAGVRAEESVPAAAHDGGSELLTLGD